jgi:predicted dehydrogenase
MNEIPVIGVIGGGMIAQVAHLPFYLSDPRCRVAAVAENRPSLVAALAVGNAAIVADHRALIDDPAIDALVISAPRSATGPITLAALKAGKHVMTEKPMAHSAEQAERLVAAARDKGLIYAVGYMKRYDPGVEAAKRAYGALLESGALGALLLVNFYDYSRSYAHPPPPHMRPAESRAARFETWPLAPDWIAEPQREAYAWFLNHGSHDVNLMTYLLGHDLTVLSAQALPHDGGLRASLQAGAVPVSLNLAKTAAGRWIEGAEFLFENGRLAFAVPSPMDTEAVTRVTVESEDGDHPAKPIETGSGWSFARQAKGFVDCLRGEATPATDGAAGLRDLELCEAIWRAAA